MADLDTSQRAVINVDGVPLTGWDSITVDPAGIVAIQNQGGTAYAVGNTAGTTTLTVAKGGRSGQTTIEVEDAPLVITLGTPEPK